MPGQVRSLVETHFGEWTGGTKLRPRIDAEPRTHERGIVVVHRADAVQSEIRIGHVGQARSTPLYFPLRVVNTVLGGAFTSRLNLNLREEHGFTYGVRSRFLVRRGAGPWCVSTAVGTDVTADAVREAVSEITTLVAEGPTEEEVDAARDYLAGVFPLELETTGQIAARIAELLVYDLPDDYYADYRDRIRSVTLEEACEVARSCIRPDEMTVVVGGDADEVQGPLEELGWGPVTVEAAPSRSDRKRTHRAWTDRQRGRIRGTGRSAECGHGSVPGWKRGPTRDDPACSARLPCCPSWAVCWIQIPTCCWFGSTDTRPTDIFMKSRPAYPQGPRRAGRNARTGNWKKKPGCGRHK